MSERLAEVPTRLLWEALLDETGTLDAADVYAVGNALGMTDQQVRLGLRRAVVDGQLSIDGRGRRATVRASTEYRQTLAADAEFLRFAYAQDAGAAVWDGRWHVVLFAIPESQRRIRDAMRDGLVRLGGAPVQGGVYVSANAWEPHVDALVARLRANAYTSTLTTSDLAAAGSDSPSELAARLWDVDSVAARYRELLGAIEAASARTVGDRHERTAVAITLAWAFSCAIEPDPLLPLELLPSPWVGTTARAAFARMWGDLETSAGDRPRPQLFSLFSSASQVQRDEDEAY